jgi:hypothetical protein
VAGFRAACTKGLAGISPVRSRSLFLGAVWIDSPSLLSVINITNISKSALDLPATRRSACNKVLLLVDEIDVRPGNLRSFCKIRTDEKHFIDRTIFCDELAISSL